MTLGCLAPYRRLGIGEWKAFLGENILWKILGRFDNATCGRIFFYFTSESNGGGGPFDSELEMNKQLSPDFGILSVTLTIFIHYS